MGVKRQMLDDLLDKLSFGTASIKIQNFNGTVVQNISYDNEKGGYGYWLGSGSGGAYHPENVKLDRVNQLDNFTASQQWVSVGISEFLHLAPNSHQMRDNYAHLYRDAGMKEADVMAFTYSGSVNYGVGVNGSVNLGWVGKDLDFWVTLGIQGGNFDAGSHGPGWTTGYSLTPLQSPVTWQSNDGWGQGYSLGGLHGSYNKSFGLKSAPEGYSMMSASMRTIEYTTWGLNLSSPGGSGSYTMRSYTWSIRQLWEH